MILRKFRSVIFYVSLVNLQIQNVSIPIQLLRGGNVHGTIEDFVDMSYNVKIDMYVRRCVTTFF